MIGNKPDLSAAQNRFKQAHALLGGSEVALAASVGVDYT